MNKIVLLLGFCITLSSFAQQNEVYHYDVNLQENSKIPYSRQNNNTESPYHFRKLKDYEIAYGRPMINIDVDKPADFYRFIKEMNNKTINNYRQLLEADLDDKDKQKLMRIRQKSLMHLQYVSYRMNTFNVVNEEILPIKNEYKRIYQKLFDATNYDLPDYIDAFYSDRALAYKYHQNYNKDLSSVHYQRYANSFSNYFEKNNQDLFLLLELEGENAKLLEELPKPDLKEKYKLNENYQMAVYRNKLNLIFRDSKQKAEDLKDFILGFLQTISKNVEETNQIKKAYVQDDYQLILQRRINELQSDVKKNILLVKNTPKYKSDVAFKNSINKYLKFVQTTGKSTFNKIKSTLDKSEDIGQKERKMIGEYLDVFFNRERDYLNGIRVAFKDMRKKYLDKSKAQAKKDKDKIIKIREQLAKEEERRAKKERKTYWKNRNQQ